jgi:hypothetical protein
MDLSASRPGEESPAAHWIGGWVGCRTGMDGVEGRKILSVPGLEHQTQAFQHLANRYTDCATTTLNNLHTLPFLLYFKQEI